MEETNKINSISEVETPEIITVEPIANDDVSAAVCSVGFLSKYCGMLFVKSFRSPVSLMSEVANDKSRFPMILWGIVHLALIFILNTIHVPFFNRFMSQDIKVQLAAFFVLIVFGVIFTHTILTFAFAKKSVSGITFKYIISNYFLATIPGTVFIILAYIFEFTFRPIIFVFLLFALFSWMLLSFQAANVCLQNIGNTFWVHFISTMISLILLGAILAFVGIPLFKDVVNDLIHNIFTVENITKVVENIFTNYIQPIFQ